MLKPTAIHVPFVCFLLAINAGSAPAGEVAVEIVENIPNKWSWDFTPETPVARFTEPAFGFVAVPRKYSPRGMTLDRSSPYLLRAQSKITLPAGKYRFLLQSRNASRLFIDDKIIASTDFPKKEAGGHEKVPEPTDSRKDGLCQMPVGHQEKIVMVTVSEGEHDFRLEAFVGGQKMRLDVGEILVAIAKEKETYRLLAPAAKIAFTEEAWEKYVGERREYHAALDRDNWRNATREEAKYWQQRHQTARDLGKGKPGEGIPGVRTPVFNVVDNFIGKKLEERNVTPAALTDDLAFLRRVSLDTVGVIPTPEEIERFLKDDPKERRSRAIERLLTDNRWADHQMGYWQDVLAENPGILKPQLNNTGPFRWWLHDMFRENLPMDRFVTELIMMEGGALNGSPGGFAMATQNDVPMAAKAHVVAKAFLGVELGCARCHDSPQNTFKQQDLFALAAMLRREPQAVPKTSSVNLTGFTRKPLIEVTLKPGTKVEPVWPFAEIAPAELPQGVLRDAKDSRERLAATITSPNNTRFAEMMVNRLWKRYLGWGFVEPVDDWFNATPSHPELLRYLSREFILHGYDVKHVSKLILNSHAYQRVAHGDATTAPEPSDRLFAAPARRRLSAEQLVDSLFVSAGKPFHSEELTMDPEARRPASEMINLGRPRRAWEFTSLSNERDRPALALPIAQSLVDLLVAHGWRDSRPNPLTVRDQTPTPLQPLVLANGIAGQRIVRLSDDSAFTEAGLSESTLPGLIRRVYRQVLTRAPSDEEVRLFEELLREGFEGRRVPNAKPEPRRSPKVAVSWSNHLSPEATKIKMELERLAREGDPPTKRLTREWRERMEDMIWSLVNSPEFVFVP